MAEGGVNPGRINKHCRYFLHGHCTKGPNCRFIHDRSRPICAFYQTNSCVLGQSCKFRHVRTEGITRPNQTGSSQTTTFIPDQIYQAVVPGHVGTLSWIPSGRSTIQREDGFLMEVCEVVRSVNGIVIREVTPNTPLCPFYGTGECQLDACEYAHGDICDMCGLPALHPLSEIQRRHHRRTCIEQHEREMERAFAIQAIQEKQCGICLESVMLKEEGDRRFGILESCNHSFCLPCIKQWRSDREASEIDMAKTCPTCRTYSNFVTPSNTWVETAEEKAQLIADYKRALKTKPCRYFKKGRKRCPFDKACFYKHALPDGTVVEGNVVRRRRGQPGRRRGREAAPQVDDSGLWDYVMARHADGNPGDMQDEVSLLLMEMEMYDDSDDEYDDNDADIERVYYSHGVEFSVEMEVRVTHST